MYCCIIDDLKSAKSAAASSAVDHDDYLPQQSLPRLSYVVIIGISRRKQRERTMEIKLDLAGNKLHRSAMRRYIRPEFSSTFTSAEHHLYISTVNQLN